jgi:response regulator of citrate/malate metabolism
VTYPGAKTRQLSLRPNQVPQVRQALQRYRQAKETLEAISELNQYLLRLDRDEAKESQS